MPQQASEDALLTSAHHEQVVTHAKALVLDAFGGQAIKMYADIREAVQPPLIAMMSSAFLIHHQRPIRPDERIALADEIWLDILFAIDEMVESSELQKWQAVIDDVAAGVYLMPSGTELQQVESSAARIRTRIGNVAVPPPRNRVGVLDDHAVLVAYLKAGAILTQSVEDLSFATFTLAYGGRWSVNVKTQYGRALRELDVLQQIQSIQTTDGSSQYQWLPTAAL